MLNGVGNVRDPLLQMELGNWLAIAGPNPARRRSLIAGYALYLAAAVAGAISLLWVILRWGGSAPAASRAIMDGAPRLFAMHGEDTTRVRDLRAAIARADIDRPIVLSLGRPSTSVSHIAARSDPMSVLRDPRFLRPVTFGTALWALPSYIRFVWDTAHDYSNFPRRVPARETVAILFRIALGLGMAEWWHRASPSSPPPHALFAHTGTADTSLLERAMQATGMRTVHVVHGTNIGWSFAGFSDLAIFQTAADARLAASLPGYGRVTHVPCPRPALAAPSKRWALLTSYSHLDHDDYHAHGSEADRRLVTWTAAVAKEVGRSPGDIVWRPHPHIRLVDETHRALLEKKIADVGFTRWPDDLPYEALGEMEIVITSPSTVMTDALRLGQPAIVANAAPLQSDLQYADYPLLANDEAELFALVGAVRDPAKRKDLFIAAWDAIGPGAPANLEAIEKVAATLS
ncbi:hypothetical protein AAW01_10290 [Aurantiacibacter gangjinensis]|uniref:Uncharacterized protein n=1 Tax=Aurantiacibacter gangjinensis TaxID=502682 RepID=A0A0G9MM96_9SPHN|nr:hypothetical protein AAW01_10290 [Aurantiacibacter gangjinensis]